jgi:hypothetical protein
MSEKPKKKKGYYRPNPQRPVSFVTVVLGIVMVTTLFVLAFVVVQALHPVEFANGLMIAGGVLFLAGGITLIGSTGDPNAAGGGGSGGGYRPHFEAHEMYGLADQITRTMNEGRAIFARTTTAAALLTGFGMLLKMLLEQVL